MAKKPTRKPAAKRELPTGLVRALESKKANADSDSLLRDLIEVWGGTRQLAVDIHAEFQKAAKGGMTRQRILEMIQRLIVTNTTHEITKVVQPSDMSDEDLEAMAMAYVKRVTADGTTPAAPTA